jgi:hypothetical protein
LRIASHPSHGELKEDTEGEATEAIVKNEDIISRSMSVAYVG